MSGICAIFNRDGSPVDRSLLEKMAEMTEYRGPDGTFIWQDGPIGILQQVMKTTPECTITDWPLVDWCNELVLAADARIDNRPELIHMLRAKGESIRECPADEELILAAYRVWGVDSPKYLIGDFAYLIWDAHQKSLFCARDALGVKQLYFCQTINALIVATELSQILVHPSVPRDLDEIYIGNFLVLNWIEPERTMFAHIQAVPAATFLVADQRDITFVHYWHTQTCKEIRYRNDDDYAEHFRELFTRALKDRLRTTKKHVGILMSGGLDSGSVAAMIQNRISQETGFPKLKAFSIVYDPFPLANEREFIQVLEKELNLDVEYIHGDEFWILRDRQAFSPNLETPEMGTEELTLFINQRFHDNQIQVVLGGQGGDHILTGSPRIYTDRIEKGDLSVIVELFKHSRNLDVPVLPMIYRYFLRPFAPDAVVDIYRKLMGKNYERPFPSWLRTDFINRISLQDQSRITVQNSRNTSRTRLETERQIKAIPFFTRNQEKSTSRAQLDARPPYADQRLAEFVIGIPQDQLYREGSWKFLLRNSMRGILPDPIRNRTSKATLEPFFHYSLREKDRKQILDLFKKPILGIMGIIDKDELNKTFERYCSREDYLFEYSDWVTTNPWHIICLELWLRKFYGIIG